MNSGSIGGTIQPAGCQKKTGIRFKQPHSNCTHPCEAIRGKN